MVMKEINSTLWSLPFPPSLPAVMYGQQQNKADDLQIQAASRR